MSPYLKEAFISIEDERFETHFGIDVKRTGAAVVKWITTGDSNFGGSTITQQLIKRVTNDQDRSWQRKAREIVRAVQLEQWLSKDQIIELYMNIIYLGDGAYGVEKAAYTYFNKSAKDLTIAECALIAGLAQSPEGRNPHNYPEKAKQRQELVLGKMLEVGKISQAQYEEAMKQELVYEKGSMALVSNNSYFVDAVVDQLIEDLQEEKGVTKIMAQKMIYSNGLKILYVSSYLFY
jgi:penicillin-binding protein 1A